MEGKLVWPAVIGINGPISSGKTLLVNGLLKELIPDAQVFHPSDQLFRHMQLNGAVSSGVDYHTFKKLFGAREKLIDYAKKTRETDPTIFVRGITSSSEYRGSRVAIIDNIGDNEEGLWFNQCASAFILLRLETKFNETEPRKSRYRRLAGLWPGDSRQQVNTRFQLTAYDSLQMALLLRWLTAPSLTREEAGPYYEYRELWEEHFRCESISGLHPNPGDTGRVERLDAPAREQSEADRIDFGLEPRGQARKSSRHQR